MKLICFVLVSVVTLSLTGHAARSTTPTKKVKKVVVSGDTTLPQMVDWKTSLERVKHLVVSGQPYVLQFEEEESWGRVPANQENRTKVTYSDEDTAKYQQAVNYLIQYRNDLNSDCSGMSTKHLKDYLDHYAQALASFHAKAVPISGDISEKNDALLLVVNRTALRDSVVLLSRYVHAKKQAYIPSIGKFLKADTNLIDAVTTIARTFQVEVSDEDTTKTYGLRDLTMENVSLLPRNPILYAAKLLGTPKETVCIVHFKEEPKKGEVEKTQLSE